MIWNLAKLFVLFIVATVAHWFFAGIGVSAGINISVMFVFVVAVCLNAPAGYGYAMAFLCGLFLDVLGTNMFGVYAVTFNLVAAITYLTSKNVDFNSIITQVVMIFLLSVFSEFLYAALGVVFFKAGQWHGLSSIIFGSVCNGFLAPFVFYIVRKSNIGADLR